MNRQQPLRLPAAREGPAEVRWADQADWRCVLGHGFLVRTALEAVQSLDWTDPDLISKSTRAFQPRMMLTLLGYCYASGIYGSQQIEEAIRQDGMVRYICARTYPDSSAIRRFRRENRAVVEQCLARILAELWFWQEDVPAHHPGSDGSSPSPLIREIRQEAYQRLEVAAFVDLMERED